MSQFRDKNVCVVCACNLPSNFSADKIFGRLEFCLTAHHALLMTFQQYYNNIRYSKQPLDIFYYTDWTGGVPS